ncbi:MAG TPA: hypothetical protein VE288_16960 [Rubrobacteraceae bacterium]|jgi:hypothetical protein|nr:hypothetical protein [Rubrobacteraceae bacterium]
MEFEYSQYGEEEKYQRQLRTDYKRRLEQLLVGLYERFLELPVAIVLASLWVRGAALIGLGVLVLYLLGVWLRTVPGM